MSRGKSFISFFLKFNPFIDSMQFYKEICAQFWINFFHFKCPDFRFNKYQLFCNNGSHYLNWDFNGKNTSHLQFLQLGIIHVWKLAKKQDRKYSDLKAPNTLFWCWKRKNAPFETFWVGKQGHRIKGQMLR